MSVDKPQLHCAVALLASAGCAAPALANFFAQRVIDTAAGTNQSAAFADPAEILGGPTGAGSNSGSTTGLYQLGVGGSITLGFGSALNPLAIQDGDGVDFIVFENSFINPLGTQAFAELVFVEVSSNGVDFARFPTQAPPAVTNGLFTTVDPDSALGFAGVQPVLANVDTNTIDPFDPALAGGDAFDLVDLLSVDAVTSGLVDLQNIQFLRLIDVLGDGSLLDSSDQPIIDSVGVFDNGADLDAVAVINGGPVPEPAAFALIGLGLLLSHRRSRHPLA